MILPTLLIAALFAVPAPAAHAPAADSTAVWRIDPAHSEVSFRIRHLMSKVRGSFREFSGTITVDSGDWAHGAVDVTIQAASIFTNNDTRDDDLRSAHFFEVDKYPTLHFRSTSVDVDGDHLKVHGDLTIRDVTKPVVLDAEFTGLMRTTAGDRIGFEASTTVNRNDWGVTWNRMVEGGGLLLGDDVKIELSVEAIRT